MTFLGKYLSKNSLMNAVEALDNQISNPNRTPDKHVRRRVLAQALTEAVLQGIIAAKGEVAAYGTSTHTYAVVASLEAELRAFKEEL